MSAGPAVAGTAQYGHAATKNRVGAFIGMTFQIGFASTNTSKSSSENLDQKPNRKNGRD